MKKMVTLVLAIAMLMSLATVASAGSDVISLSFIAIVQRTIREFSRVSIITAITIQFMFCIMTMLIPMNIRIISVDRKRQPQMDRLGLNVALSGLPSI